ncbi:peptide ABC transporter [Mycobacterium tuberculosis]|nr:peptide ABC transporter [Mycobacterium tuberculosis]
MTEFASRRTLVVRRFLRNRAAVASLAALLLLFVSAYALPPLLPYSYDDLDFNALLSRRAPSTGWGLTRWAKICWRRRCVACRSRC